MNCDDFQHVLEQAAESRAPYNRPELIEHAAGCAACRALWEQQAALDRAISEWRRGVPDVDLADSVLSKLMFESAPRRSRAEPRARRRLTLRIAAAAAVLALAAVLLVMRASTEPDRVAQSPRRQTEEAQTEETPSATIADASVPRGDADAADQVEPSAMVREAGSAYWTLASRTATALTDGMALVSPLDFAAAPVEPADSRPAGSPSWVDELGRDFAPLRDDFSRAIDMLLEAVPADDVSAAL